MSKQGLESSARRAAQRVGLVARKSRWRAGTIDNEGGFMIVDPSTNVPVFGCRWNLSAEDILEYCAEK